MNLSSKKAITLTELIVATIIIGIIMLGVSSVDYVIRKSKVTTSKSAQIATQAASMMNHITRSVSLAIGDKNNPGIEIWRGIGTDNITNLCIRQDVNGTPGNYCDDIWVRYGHGDSKNLFVTLATTPDTLNPECPSQCSLEDPPAQGGTEDAFPLGHIQDLQYTFVNPDNCENPSDPCNGGGPDDLYLDVTLTTRWDTSQAADPNNINNPEYTLSSQIMPFGHSW